jgi:hypothetical protein
MIALATSLTKKLNLSVSVNNAYEFFPFDSREMVSLKPVRTTHLTTETSIAHRAGLMREKQITAY